MKEVYLDNAATTKVFPTVVKKMKSALTEIYGNPSSLHNKGLTAENLVKTARERIAEQLQVAPKGIYFTSGGTEANNLALLGAARRLNRYGQRIVTTPIEHPSVQKTIQHLADKGWEVEYVNVDETGKIDLNHLEQLITSETVLVSIIGVNNELGSIQPLKKITNLTQPKKNLYLHVDGVQALGKVEILPAQLGIDLYSISGHKIHGPKGVGALYINPAVKIESLFYGGNQEAGIRPGTENVPGIVGFGQAVKLLPENTAQMYKLKERLITKLTSEVDNCQVNGPTARKGAPQIVNISFAGIKGEVLVHSLEEEGIYISTGSACHSRQEDLSHVLEAIEVGPKYRAGTVRFSLSSATTKAEIDYTVNVLKDKVSMLRQYM